MHFSYSAAAAVVVAVLATAEAKFFGQPTYIKYSTVTGFFLQDDNSTNATTFNYVSF